MEADTPLDSGMNTTFALFEGKDPSTAVHYVDGDGEHLMGDFFPGLLDFARSQNIPCQNVQPHDVTLVPFREFGDDAPELGHVYYLGAEEATVCSTSSRANTATRVVVPFGYHALVHAMTSTTVTVVPMGADAGGEAPSGAICGQRSCVNWGGKNKSWPELSNPPCTNAMCDVTFSLQDNFVM